MSNERKVEEVVYDLWKRRLVNMVGLKGQRYQTEPANISNTYRYDK